MNNKSKYFLHLISYIQLPRKYVGIYLTICEYKAYKIKPCPIIIKKAHRIF